MKISFDFDNTLELNVFQRLAKKYIENGDEVWIVTSRREVYQNNIDSNTDLYTLAYRLGIENDRIHFTNNKSKLEFFKENPDFDLHYEDDCIEAKYILEKTDVDCVCHNMYYTGTYGNK